MNLLINFCLVLFVLVAALMVFVILMQRPKSEGLGAAFGGGVTENIFGAQTTNVLVKFTTWLAGIFFALTFALSVLYAHHSVASSAFRRELMKTSPSKPHLHLRERNRHRELRRHRLRPLFLQPQAQHRQVRQNHSPLVLSGIFGPVATALRAVLCKSVQDDWPHVGGYSFGAINREKPIWLCARILAGTAREVFLSQSRDQCRSAPHRLWTA